jgi:hypothetical protein
MKVGIKKVIKGRVSSAVIYGDWRERRKINAKSKAKGLILSL